MTWLTALGPLVAEYWQVLAAIAGAAVAYMAGRSSEKSKHIKKKAKADEKAHDRINKVQPVDADDRDDILERLRRHSE